MTVRPPGPRPEAGPPPSGRLLPVPGPSVSIRRRGRRVGPASVRLGVGGRRAWAFWAGPGLPARRGLGGQARRLLASGPPALPNLAPGPVKLNEPARAAESGGQLELEGRRRHRGLCGWGL